MSVVPKGVGETAGGMDAPGTGVAVAGTVVGRAVPLGVAVGGGGGGGGVGRRVGAGVGEGAVTTIVGPAILGFVAAVLTDVNVTGQLPAGSVPVPVQVPFR